MTQAISIEISEDIYTVAARVAEAANRPLNEVINELLRHSLPPLSDLPPAEAATLAQLSVLDDHTLWRQAATMLLPEEQYALAELLDSQSAGELDAAGLERLDELLERYGEITVRKAHAWLLLARRGYVVPPQEING